MRSDYPSILDIEFNKRSIIIKRKAVALQLQPAGEPEKSRSGIDFECIPACKLKEKVAGRPEVAPPLFLETQRDRFQIASHRHRQSGSCPW